MSAKRSVATETPVRSLWLESQNTFSTTHNYCRNNNQVLLSVFYPQPSTNKNRNTEALKK